MEKRVDWQWCLRLGLWRRMGVRVRNSGMRCTMWWRGGGLECRGNEEENKARRDISEKTEPIGTDGCMNIGNGGDQTSIHLRSISGRL